MSRRLLVVLIALVGSAGVVVAVLAVFFLERDRTTLAEPGPVRSIEIDVEAGRVEVVPGGDEAMITRTRHFLLVAPATSESLVQGVLRIEARCEALIVAGCAVDYRVEAPAGLGGRQQNEGGSRAVIATTSAGHIRIHPR